MRTFTEQEKKLKNTATTATVDRTRWYFLFPLQVQSNDKFSRKRGKLFDSGL